MTSLPWSVPAATTAVADSSAASPASARAHACGAYPVSSTAYASATPYADSAGTAAAASPNTTASYPASTTRHICRCRAPGTLALPGRECTVRRVRTRLLVHP